MKFIFDPSNEDELFAARDVINALCNAHSDSRTSIPDSAPIAIPDALASIAPEPLVITTPAPEEITPPVVDAAPDTTTVVEPETASEQTQDDDNFDVTGLPWDGRIHSSGKTKTTKGAWTRRRNLDDAYYAQILAEISAVPQAVQAATETEQVLAATAPPVPEIPAAADAGFGGVSTGEMTWPDVVQVVMKAKVQELVSQEQLDQKAGELGIAGGFNNLVSRPDLYARYIMELGI